MFIEKRNRPLACFVCGKNAISPLFQRQISVFGIVAQSTAPASVAEQRASVAIGHAASSD